MYFVWKTVTRTQYICFLFFNQKIPKQTNKNPNFDAFFRLPELKTIGYWCYKELSYVFHCSHSDLVEDKAKASKEKTLGLDAVKCCWTYPEGSRGQSRLPNTLSVRWIAEHCGNITYSTGKPSQKHRKNVVSVLLNKQQERQQFHAHPSEDQGAALHRCYREVTARAQMLKRTDPAI